MVSIGSQFSTGDQASRESFWRSGFKICNSCKKQCIKEEDHVAGCRHNGMDMALQFSHALHVDGKQAFNTTKHLIYTITRLEILIVFRRK